MDELIIVVAGSMPIFHNWCRDNDENPRDKKFLYVIEPHRLRGLGGTRLGPKLKLLLLHGWAEKIFVVPVWSEDELTIEEWVPNELMENLMAVFMKPWVDIVKDVQFN